MSNCIVPRCCPLRINRPEKVHTFQPGAMVSSRFGCLKASVLQYTPMMARCSKQVIAPLGDTIYTVGADRTAKLWDTAELDQQNPHPRAIMRGHLKYVLAADMSPDEKMLVTGGADKALNLWEVPSGRLLGHLQGHTSDVESVVFTPNGRIVVSASEDRSIRIWSVDYRQELAMLAFQKNGDEYAGVTFDNRTFGTPNSGLLSVYVDGKQIPRSEAEHVVQYIGRGIVIIEKEE